MIAVTFALPAESQKFLRSLGRKSRDDRNGISVIRSELDDRTIEVLHTGVGEKVCRQRIGKFLQDQHFDYLISAGFAGALTDDLRVGDLVLAEYFSTVDLGKRWSSLSSLPIQMANLLTIPVKSEKHLPAKREGARCTWRRYSSRVRALGVAVRCFRFE